MKVIVDYFGKMTYAIEVAAAFWVEVRPVSDIQGRNKFC